MVALTEQERDMVDRLNRLPPERRRYVMRDMFGTDTDEIALPAPPKTKSAVLARKFERLADKWESETRPVASPRKITSHSLVRQIVGIGRPAPFDSSANKVASVVVVPLIKGTVEKGDFIAPAMRGDLNNMSKAWIKLGADRGLINSIPLIARERDHQQP